MLAFLPMASQPAYMISALPPSHPLIVIETVEERVLALLQSVAAQSECRCSNGPSPEASPGTTTDRHQ